MAEVIETTPGSRLLPFSLRRVSWGSIFAGSFCALAIGITLNVIGAAVFVHPTSEGGIMGLGIGAAIWFIGAMLIAFFIGGWVAGRLCGVPTAGTGALHGLVAWSLCMVALVYFLSVGVGNLVITSTSLLGSSVQAAGNVAAQRGIPADATTSEQAQNMKQEARNDLKRAAVKAEAGIQKAAIGTGILLVLTCLCSLLGGAAGAPKRILAPATTTLEAPPTAVVEEEQPPISPRRVA